VSMFIISLNRSYSQSIIMVIFVINHLLLTHIKPPQAPSCDHTKSHSISIDLIHSHLTLPYLNRHQLDSNQHQFTWIDLNWSKYISVDLRLSSTSIIDPNKSQLTSSTSFDCYKTQSTLLYVHWLQLSWLHLTHNFFSFRWLLVICCQWPLTLLVSLEVSGDIFGTWIRSVIRVLYLGGRGGRPEWETGVASLWLSYL